MKSIAWHVEKGGTGKTTMAGNVAFELRHYGKTVMVDGDPQGNLTGWYVTDGIEADLADVLQGQAELTDALIEVRGGLYLLPTIAIDGELKSWSETVLPNRPFAFSDLRDALEEQGFDFAVFDLGPGISMLEKSILATADEVIGVLLPETFSVDGLEVFENELEKLRKDRRASFRCNRIVVNRLNRSYSLHNAYLGTFDDLDYTVYQIGQSTRISDAVPRHLTVFEYDPGNRNTSEFQRIAQEVAHVRTPA
jgi:cellulose biosynthesis protein BcsQ